MTQQNTLHQGNKIRSYIGSTLLFIGIFSSATIIGIAILLTTPFPFSVRYRISAAWCTFVLWMTKVFCGLTYEVEGLEHINPQQPAIVLSNHQSAWETLALRCILPTQVVLLKRSLTLAANLGLGLGNTKIYSHRPGKSTCCITHFAGKGNNLFKPGIMGDYFS